MPEPDGFTFDLVADIAAQVSHPAGVVLDAAGDPLLDEHGNPIFEEQD